MSTCRDCKFYKQIDDTVGDCFGAEVPGNQDASKCPANAYQPKD